MTVAVKGESPEEQVLLATGLMWNRKADFLVSILEGLVVPTLGATDIVELNVIPDLERFRAGFVRLQCHCFWARAPL
ncbi:unnamed protein product [Merluccius merluccius]